VRLLDTDDDGEPDTLYIADNPDHAQARKVWRFNYNGWAASENGYNGPFKMGATLNDGLLADFVTAANLVAGTIQSVDGETFYLNLDTGEMRLGEYASKAELATSGGTVINGGNITTGTMTANRIRGGTLSIGGINDANGVITVYDANGTNCGSLSNTGIRLGDLAALYVALTVDGGLSINRKLSVGTSTIARLMATESAGVSIGNLTLSRYDGTGTKRIFEARADGVMSIESPTSATDGIDIDAGAGKVYMWHNSKATVLLDANDGTITLRDSSGNTNITLNGSTGRIDCKSLYINGTKVTP
jgi:hypothetical protein